MNKKKIILIYSIVSVILIVAVLTLLVKNRIKNNKLKESSKQEEQVEVIDRENQLINNEIDEISKQIEELEKQKNENETEEIEKKIEELEKKKETLNIQKEENDKKIESIKENNAQEKENNAQEKENNAQENQQQDVNNDNKKEEQYTINVSNTNITVEEGKETQVDVYFTNPKAEFLSIGIMAKNNNGIFYSDFTRLNNGKCTVNIKGLKVGSAQIEITEFNTPNVKRIVNVTVTPKIKATGIVLDRTSVEVTIGQVGNAVIGADIIPENARNRNVIWKSSNENIAKPSRSVIEDDTYCTVKPVGEGTCIFTATTEDGGYSATCQVVVKAIHVTGIRMDYTIKKSGDVGESIQLNWYVDPYNASNRKVNWKSSDTSIATVDENGLVTFKKVGMADIIGITEDGGYKGTIVVQCIPRY